MKFSGMRKIIFIVFVICFAVCLVLAALRVRDRAVYANYRGLICIDAGHGGFDPGAVGHHTDVGEDVINLAVAQELKAEFERRGFAVLMTREDDGALAGTKAEDMQMRRDIIRESNADLMISIHMNANGDTSVSGPIAYYYPESAEGQLFAQCVQDELNKQLKPARDKIINCDKYYVLRAGAMPSIIVELGFITNADDAWRIQQPDYQAQAVAAIADGTEAFLVARAQLENTGQPGGTTTPGTTGQPGDSALPDTTGQPETTGMPCETPAETDSPGVVPSPTESSSPDVSPAEPESSPGQCVPGCKCTPPCRCKKPCICGMEVAKPITD